MSRRKWRLHRVYTVVWAYGRYLEVLGAALDTQSRKASAANIDMSETDLELLCCWESLPQAIPCGVRSAAVQTF